MSTITHHIAHSTHPRLAREAGAVLEGMQSSVLGTPQWRIGSEPFQLDSAQIAFLQSLGGHLLTFYRALNHLYIQSRRGRLPDWVARYLEAGKPAGLTEYSTMNRFKSHLPGIIRPDLILTEGGMTCTELDAVPGGFGLTACLAQQYSRQGHSLIGGPHGIPEAFARMIRSLVKADRPHLAIIVSEESQEYLSEMHWMADALSRAGLPAEAVEPGQIEFTEQGLFLAKSGGNGGAERIRLEAVYRFFELFDLKNIPKSELILYAAKKGWVAMTPPVKPSLEEKLGLALFHHPLLESFWQEQLGQDTWHILQQIFPKTWILDPRAVPPHAVIPGLQVQGRGISDWRDLGKLSQNERHYVIKPSGFSPLAWGSRGVRVGHDLSETDWQAAIEEALGAFEQTPHILQSFHKGQQVQTSYLEVPGGSIQSMSGRVRLCPYYFVAEGRAELGGVLATICPLDKKLLHGMSEAVMVPCSPGPESPGTQGSPGKGS